MLAPQKSLPCRHFDWYLPCFCLFCSKNITLDFEVIFKLWALDSDDVSDMCRYV